MTHLESSKTDIGGIPPPGHVIGGDPVFRTRSSKSWLERSDVDFGPVPLVISSRFFPVSNVVQGFKLLHYVMSRHPVSTNAIVQAVFSTGVAQNLTF